MRHLLPVFIAVAVVAAACSGGDGSSSTTDRTAATTSAAAATTTTEAESRPSVAGEIPAPEFPVGLDWLNTSTPLALSDLRGKVVLLDFWTYGCINCIHIIPDLKRLETEYADELVVIGVHSAKFTNESATENIRQVVLRYDIEHPVVNDPDFVVWRTWGANAWPTLFLIDPAGNVVGSHAGERVYEIVEPVLARLVDEFDARGEVDRSPLEFDLESEGLPRTLLSFPGKVLATPSSGRLFIADTGNHRVIQADRATGEVVAVYGSGRRGFDDGTAADARFDSPQGMALLPDESTLYVADTNNHTIRAIDLETGDVTTVLGTGAQARAYPPTPGVGPNVELSSPWDLDLADGILYIAMAGSHQLWTFDLATGEAAAIVGTGGESTRNGPGAESELAQPSGLVVGDDGRLYFADSESSSIRFTNLASPDLITATLAGSDRTLFDFGDEDGLGTQARLQHPLGIEWVPGSGTLLIADTYNSKIKEVDPADGSVTTRFGTEQGWADGADPRFFEPGGVSLVDSMLYVADTNNHAVRVIDLTSGTAATLVLQGIERFTPPPEDEDYAGTIIELEPVVTGTGPGSFVLDIALPPEHKVNEEAPSSIEWRVEGAAVSLGVDADRNLTGVAFPVEVPADFTTGTSEVIADVTIVYCRDGAESLCFIEQIRFRVPVTVGDASVSPRVLLPYRIELPEV